MKIKYRTAKSVFVGGLVLTLASISQGQIQIYNFENDFSQTVNTETSIWSYRWKDGFIRDGNYALLPFFSTTNFAYRLNIPYCPIWTRTASDNYPSIGVNDSGGVLYDVQDPNWPWPAGQSNIHPDGAGRPYGRDAFAVVSWLSPVNGVVNIKMRVTDLDGRTDGGGNGVDYYVDKGSAKGNLVSGVIPNGGDTGFFWLYDVPVSGGDRLNFIIGPDGRNVYNDSTRLFVEITLIPEPSALALLVLASVALFFCCKANVARFFRRRSVLQH